MWSPQTVRVDRHDQLGTATAGATVRGTRLVGTVEPVPADVGESVEASTCRGAGVPAHGWTGGVERSGDDCCRGLVGGAGEDGGAAEGGRQGEPGPVVAPDSSFVGGVRV
jgi:hypothetical protein